MSRQNIIRFTTPTPTPDKKIQALKRNCKFKPVSPPTLLNVTRIRLNESNVKNEKKINFKDFILILGKNSKDEMTNMHALVAVIMNKKN